MPRSAGGPGLNPAADRALGVPEKVQFSLPFLVCSGAWKKRENAPARKSASLRRKRDAHVWGLIKDVELTILVQLWLIYFLLTL